MIITCPSCEKKFEIDAALIPNKGRTLKCGSCDKVWFFKMNLETKSNFTEEKIDKLVNDETLEKTDNLIKKSKSLKKTNDKALVKYKKKTSYSLGLFLRHILVFLLSFVALIIFLDTLKGPLSNFIPNLELILFNLNETIKDIFLFLRDLIK